MNKKIFVIGCSYSHHDIYVKPDETWPALLQEQTGHTIINCSIPGSSNFSYFYRLKEMEKHFGKPDQVIVQITGLSRLFFHLKNTSIQNITKLGERNYYYDLHQNAHKSVGYFVTPSVLHDKRVLTKLRQQYKISKKFVKEIYRHLATDSYLEWQLIKEMKLIDLYYKNVFFFSWNYECIHLEVKKYIGSIKDNLLKDKFDEYSWIAGEDDHFGIEGHKAVLGVIQKYV